MSLPEQFLQDAIKREIRDNPELIEAFARRLARNFDYLDGRFPLTGEDIADEAIDSDHYVDGSIDNAHLADDAVDSDELAAGAVDPAHMAAVPAARAYNSGNLSIDASSLTALTFDSERFDTDSLHSTSSNTSRLTAPTAGIYVISASVRWANDSSGHRLLSLRVSGSTSIANSRIAPAAGVTEQTVSTVYSLSASQYVEALVFHTSSTDPLNILASSAVSPELSMIWIGPTS